MRAAGARLRRRSPARSPRSRAIDGLACHLPPSHFLFDFRPTRYKWPSPRRRPVITMMHAILPDCRAPPSARARPCATRRADIFRPGAAAARLMPRRAASMPWSRQIDWACAGGAADRTRGQRTGPARAARRATRRSSPRRARPFSAPAPRARETLYCTGAPHIR